MTICHKNHSNDLLNFCAICEVQSADNAAFISHFSLVTSWILIWSLLYCYSHLVIIRIQI